MNRLRPTPLRLLTCCSLLSAPLFAQEPHDVEQRLERLERENQDLRLRLDALDVEVERSTMRDLFPAITGSRYGLGPAASKVYGASQGLSIGGYGEAIYTNRQGQGSDTVDFLRAITYFGYKFDDRWVFNSEIEFEHAATDQEGSVSVEFAYLDRLIREEFNLRAGLLLVPMGFINELHEPTTFLSAARPETERRIIPSTWRENGVGVFGQTGELSYKAYVVNGFDADGFSASGLRGGRQKGSIALAEDLAVVGRLDYEATPGLSLGGSVYYGDSGQGQDLGDVGTSIYELHAEWRHRGLRLRALAAQAELDDVARLNDARGLTGDASVGERLRGAYVEAGYELLQHLAPGSRSSFTPFVRWETLDTQDSVPAGFSSRASNDNDILTFGVSYQPIDSIVFKLDYEDWDNGTDRWNLLMGYVF